MYVYLIYDIHGGKHGALVIFCYYYFSSLRRFREGLERWGGWWMCLLSLILDMCLVLQRRCI